MTTIIMKPNLATRMPPRIPPTGCYSLAEAETCE
jgi:hypothetical protein